MDAQSGVEVRRLRVGRYAWALAGVWTLIVAVLMWREYGDDTKHMREEARTEARVHLNKNQAIRLWAASHGGVYVPIDARTPPNPYLLLIPERDVETPSGRKLTLMNPAYILRQLGEEYSDLYGAREHLTSLKPLRPENAPDEWERQALESFERGETEALEFTEAGGELALRFMRPLMVEEACLKCHGGQGYQVGDVRGGMGILLPLTRLQEAARVEMLRHARNFAFLWLLGLCGIGLSARRLTRQTREQDQAEEALQESEDRFRQFAEHIPEVFWIFDNAQQKLTYVNPAYEEIWGRSRESAYENPEAFIETVSPEYRDNVSVGIQRQIRGELAETEYPITRPDGALRWIRNRSFAIRDHAGEAYGFAGIAEDITERKRAEEALQASEERNRTYIDHSPYGMFIVNASGRYLDVNGAACRLTGYVESELLSMSIADLTAPDPESQRLAQESFQALLIAGRRSSEVPIRRKDASEFYMSINAVQLSEDRYMGFGIDVTERRRMEQELQTHAEDLEQRVEERASQVRELERQRGVMEKLAATGRMAAAVAHEINNPLAGIKNAFLVLKDAVPPDHEDYHFAELILREIERIANIVRQMHQLYQPGSAEPVEVDVASELREVCEMLDQKLKQRLLRIRTVPIPALTAAILPAGHLRQILYNLIANAIEASPEGGEIGLAVTSLANTVHIRVSDDGEGIPPEALGSIFEPFFTTKNRVDHAGMGLGLPVSQSLARAMGGDIIVETGVGKGTAFTLVLPCKAQNEGMKGTDHE